MPRFRYTASDPGAEGGSWHSGEMEADSPSEVADRLNALGLRAEAIAEVEIGPEDSGAFEPLSDAEAAELVEHVAGLASAGLPLAEGLRALGDELPRTRMRRTIARLADRVEHGQSLAEALEADQRRFPPHLRGLVLAGARSGQLAEVLNHFLRYHHVGVNLRRRIWLSLAYPLLLLAATLALFVFVCHAIVESFAVIFTDFGVSLPMVTVQLLKVARVLTDVNWGVVLGVAAGIIVIVLLEHMFARVPMHTYFTSRLPVIGPLWHWVGLAEFCHLLGMLLESRLPLTEALPLAGSAVRQVDLSQACQRASDEVAKGQPLAFAIAADRRFPRSLAPLLHWAEGHQTLSDALHLTGNIFEARARTQAAFLSTVSVVLTVILVLWGISFIVIALFLPLVQLISELSGVLFLSNVLG